MTWTVLIHDEKLKPKVEKFKKENPEFFEMDEEELDEIEAFNRRLKEYHKKEGENNDKGC